MKKNMDEFYKDFNRFNKVIDIVAAEFGLDKNSDEAVNHGASIYFEMRKADILPEADLEEIADSLNGIFSGEVTF